MNSVLSTIHGSDRPRANVKKVNVFHIPEYSILKDLPTRYDDEPFKVYVQPAHLAYVPGGKGEMPIEAGLMRVADGTIDGYICAIDTGDTTLKANKLTTINRQVFFSLEIKGVIPKVSKRKAANSAFSKALDDLREKGLLSSIYPHVFFSDKLFGE